MTLSTAYSKLKVSMDLYPSLAACRAASLQMLAMSAPGNVKDASDEESGGDMVTESKHHSPLKPGVNSARRSE